MRQGRSRGQAAHRHDGAARLKPAAAESARQWFVSGRVQGVGFRWFVQQRARELQLNGWVRNEGDGRVQVYAAGTPDKLNLLAAALHQGPRMAEVRGVEEREAAVQQLNSFESR